jgi:two-component system OmpR family sensor kinase
MVQDITRIEGLVDDILALSAAETFHAGPPSRLELAQECRAVVEELGPFAADRDARIELRVAGGHWILGHRVTFALALRNLVVNAVTHSPHPVRVEISLADGPKWHSLTVRDDGPGIPRRLHEKIFECFHVGGHGDGNRSGAGLGLYLVKRNVESLGGWVELDSAEGAGSAFTMILPAVDAGT